MKKLMLTLGIILLFSFTAFSQISFDEPPIIMSPDSNVNYRLYRTNNNWTFLKLDTRDGTITHVQYSIEGDRMEYPLSNYPLAIGEEAKTGRFFLYPTRNHYNFLLLDQIDGRVWQVQWSIEEKDRGIWRIY